MPCPPKPYELLMLRKMAAYQFGLGAERIFEKITVTRSSSTGRVRNVYRNGVLIATIRLSDGALVPTIEGARLLVKTLEYPRRRVVVCDEAVEFVARGRSVFCKHVVNVDPELLPGDEVIVVDRRDEVVAVGKMLLAGCEALRFKRGVCVKVRKGTKAQ